MYTTELKNEVTAKLIARNGSTNPWIYRSHYVIANNLESLLYGKEYNAGWTIKAIQSRINNGNMVPVELRDEYRDYHDKVIKITNKQDLSTLTNIEKRGVIGKDEDAHHVDHIFSIYDGFMNDVPADVIGNICNLQCIPGLINIAKRNDSWITLKELYDRYEQQFGI